MTDNLRIRSKSEIPGFVLFRDDGDGFIDRGLARQKLREQYQKLKAERGEIKKRPASISDLKKKLHRSYDDYLAGIIQNARKFIEHNRNNPDIFQHFQKRSERYKLHDYMPLEVFEKALDEIAENDDPNAITESQRKKELGLLEKKISEIKSKLAAVSPPGDFEMGGAEIHGDLYAQFYNYWAGLQNSSRGEVGLEGRILRDCPENEIKIFYRLGLDKI